MSDEITIPVDLLECLIDEEECWFDHHGGCQAHGYLSLKPGEKCPHQEAKERLAAHRRMWKQYKRKGLSEMRPYQLGEDMSGISVSQADAAAGSPKPGDMIARNPKDHTDQWLVSAQYFSDNMEPD